MNVDAAFRTAKHAVRAFLAVLALTTTAVAQDWHGADRSAFWPRDIVARLVADGLQQKYPASAFIVENKPGAGDNLGTDLVAKATPDGSTIGV
ncbi:MAG: tripartite tricarboxylate transporter substrate-binding protein, partial [Pseudolabrys sp.]